MRYLPHTSEDVRRMLDVIGADDIETLFASVPESLRPDAALELDFPLSEFELKRHLGDLAGAAAPVAFVGAGAYPHTAPTLVDHLISRTEFYSAYTPYQPEVSQGTLQAIFEFQTIVAQLTGLDVANASVYDGASACAEAVLMAHRVLRGKRDKVLVSAALHPEYREVLATYCAATSIRIEEVAVDTRGQTDAAAVTAALDQETAALVVQAPNFFGVVEDVAPLARAIHDVGGLAVAVLPEPVALGLMCTPGEAGADIAVGEGLGLTGALSFGGPGFGYFAARRQHMRQMPGRLAGATVDRNGERGFVLTLSTREQHIRREKATSNICTNQGLCALAGAITVSLLGPAGLRELALANLAKAEHAKRRAQAAGLKLVFAGPTFNEFVLDVGVEATDRMLRLAEQGVVAGVDLGRFDPKRRGQVLFCATEVHPREAIDATIDALAGRRAPR